MEIIHTKLPGCMVLVPKKFEDERGWFSESWNSNLFSAANLPIDFVQDNHSFSARKNTVRGLHFQSPPYAQDKLVRVAVGSIIDVAVDVRVGSPTYGEWVAEYLSEQNGKQLLVPKGFLHGFVTAEDNVHVMYKCSSVFSPENDGAVRFDDPTLSIDWNLDPSLAVTLSDKDNKAPLFKEIESPFIWEGIL